MKITIIYDNKAYKEHLKADWGFSCLVEAYGKRILFDTGESGPILLHNMSVLNIAPSSIDEVFISHTHFDHSGGLSVFLDENSNVDVYAPSPLRGINRAREVVYVDEFRQMHERFYSTGLLNNIEQSLMIETEKGLVIIVGCSHPGVDVILNAAAQLGTPYAIIGGLHGFKDFNLIRELEYICPTHCTQFKAEIKSLYPDKYIQGGAGRKIEL